METLKKKITEVETFSSNIKIIISRIHISIVLKNYNIKTTV